MEQTHTHTHIYAWSNTHIMHKHLDSLIQHTHTRTRTYTFTHIVDINESQFPKSSSFLAVANIISKNEINKRDLTNCVVGRQPNYVDLKQQQLQQQHVHCYC